MDSTVSCVGNIVVDVVLTGVSGLPDEGSLEIFERKEMYLGGCASNTAIALSRLGVPVSLRGKVGSDREGGFCAEVLRGNNVVADIIYSSADETSSSVIIVPPSGNRMILHALGANEHFYPKEILWEHLVDKKILFIGGLGILPLFSGDDLRALLHAARLLGLTTVADTATNHAFSQSDWEKTLGLCYPFLDVFFPSEEEAYAITGQRDPEKICAIFRERGVEVAGVKLGDSGCIVSSSLGTFRIPPHHVNCADTLGAGDAFMAGYIAALLYGYNHPGQAARAGNVVGACCVSAVGTSAGIPPFEEVRRAMLNEALQNI